MKRTTMVIYVKAKKLHNISRIEHTGVFILLLTVVSAGAIIASPGQNSNLNLDNDVRIIKDIEYAVVNNISLKLDLYIPKNTKSRPFLVMFIHSGAWMSGDKSGCRITWLTEHGYALASINYRLSWQAIFPAQIHDCKGAVRWLRAHADEYGYKKTRIGAAGSSAGGHLAALLATTGGMEELEGDENLDKAKLASPALQISKKDSPLLILHGNRDLVVPVSQSRILHRRYKRAGLSSILHIIQGAAHGGHEFQDETRRQLIISHLDEKLKKKKKN